MAAGDKGGAGGGGDVSGGGGGGGGEPAKTVLLPFLQRADELQKHDPLVAYYCRLFGMERGLKIPSKERTKTTNALLVSLMNQLEKDKKTVKLSPDDNLHVEGFALGVFSKADKQDRAGRADLNTAKTFYAASIFFEVLNQFGELQPEIEQKQKYAVWKAADIRKALSEGRRPQPGPPGGDEGFSLDELSSYDQEEDGLKPSESTTARSTFSAESDAHGKSENGDFAPGPGYPTPSSFQDHHTMQERYPTGYGASYYPSPATDHTVPPPVPDSSYPTNSAFPSQGFHPPGVYYSSVSNDRTENAPPPFSSSYYPASGSFNYPSAPTTDSHAAPFTSSYETPAPAPTYENPLQRTSSAPANPEVPKAATYDSGGYNPPPERIAEAHKASRFAVGALAFDDVPTAISYLRRSLELLTSPSATIR